MVGGFLTLAQSVVLFDARSWSAQTGLRVLKRNELHPPVAHLLEIKGQLVSGETIENSFLRHPPLRAISTPQWVRPPTTALNRVGLFSAFERFRYAPSTRPKKTIADATPVKTHTGSKPLPNGRSELNPSASAATETTPLKITGQFIGTPRFLFPPVLIASQTIKAEQRVEPHSILASGPSQLAREISGCEPITYPPPA